MEVNSNTRNLRVTMSYEPVLPGYEGDRPSYVVSVPCESQMTFEQMAPVFGEALGRQILPLRNPMLVLLCVMRHVVNDMKDKDDMPRSQVELVVKFHALLQEMFKEEIRQGQELAEGMKSGNTEAVNEHIKKLFQTLWGDEAEAVKNIKKGDHNLN